MQQIDLPFFGKVSINRNIVEQDYQTYIEFEGLDIELNLIYETENMELSNLLIIKDFLDNFDKYYKKALDFILKNIKENGIARDFIKTNIDAINPLGIEVLKETLAKGMSLEDYFISDLELNLIYMFADSDDEFIKLNFQISEELTDEILFVRFGQDLNIKEISIEF